MESERDVYRHVMNAYISNVNRQGNRDLRINQTFEVISYLESVGTDVALTLAGDIYLDLCATEPDRPTQGIMLQLAHNKWLAAVNTWTPSEPLTAHVLRATTQLACEPGYRSVLVDGELADVETAQKMYSQLCEVTKIGAKALEDYEGNTGQELAGQLAEAETLLILQRFSLQQLGDGSWLALPSQIHEDFGHNNGYQEDYATGGAEGWDISVFTNYGDEPEATYKVQVKSSGHSAHAGGEYQSDIAVINPWEDGVIVAFDDRRKVSAGSIARGCCMENELGRIRASETLDARTERILDILG